MISIVALTEETRRELTSLEREQFPFALAKTLTDVAEGAADDVRVMTRRTFELRSGEFIPRGIRKIPAKKSDVKATGVGTSVVYTADKISSFMPIHESGGVRTASVGNGNDKGKYLAQPGEGLKKLSYRTSRGSVKRRYTPGTLLKAAKHQQRLPPSVYSQVIQGKVRNRKGTPFVIRGKNSGVPMIVRRLTNMPNPIEVLYVFSKRAKYKKQWRFEHTVRRHVDEHFSPILQRNLNEAIATATSK